MTDKANILNKIKNKLAERFDAYNLLQKYSSSKIIYILTIKFRY